MTQNIKEDFLGNIRTVFKARVPPAPEPAEPQETPKDAPERINEGLSADKSKVLGLQQSPSKAKETSNPTERVLQFSDSKGARPTHQEGKKSDEEELRELQPKEVSQPLPEPAKGPKQSGILSFFNGKAPNVQPDPLPAEKENKRKRK